MSAISLDIFVLQISSGRSAGGLPDSSTKLILFPKKNKMNYLNGNRSAMQHPALGKALIIGSLECGAVCDWQSLIFMHLKNLVRDARAKIDTSVQFCCRLCILAFSDHQIGSGIRLPAGKPSHCSESTP